MPAQQAGHIEQRQRAEERKQIELLTELFQQLRRLGNLTHRCGVGGRLNHQNGHELLQQGGYRQPWPQPQKQIKQHWQCHQP